jgi:transposase
MDVHKDTVDMVVMREDSQEPILEMRIHNDRKSIERFFWKLPDEGPVVAGYEAGCMGFEPQRNLSEMGVECVVIAPGLIPRKPGERVKTDRRDARIIAKLLKNGEAEAIHVPEPADEAVRDFIRARDDLRQERRRHCQRLSHLLLRHGYAYGEGRHWTLRHRRWLSSLKVEESTLKETIEIYYNRILELEGKLADMDQRIQELCGSERYAEAVGKLRCFRGIDWLTALALSCEIGDFRRFGTAEEFMSFLGIVPSEESSGQKRRQGGITKAGNGHLRRLLVEASWHYRYYRPPSRALWQRRRGQSEAVIAHADRGARRLSKKFHRLILRGKPSQLAVTATARELAGFVWAVMVGKTDAVRPAA